MRRASALGLALLIGLLPAAACSGGDNAEDAAKEAVDEALDEPEDELDDELEAELGDGEDLDVDDCTLLTDEEVSELAGEALTSTEDSFLGCGWVEEGKVVARFSIRSFRSDASVAEHAKELSSEAELVEIEGVGDEAAGLVTSDDEINFLLARDGELFVEMVMTFLDVPPDSENFEVAKELAKKALERLTDAA